MRTQPNSRKPKLYTPDQVEKKKEKAVRFLRDVVGDDDRADEIEDMSVAEYAEHKHLRMANPRGHSIANHKSQIPNRQSAIANRKLKTRTTNHGPRVKNSGAERCRQYRDRCVPMDELAFVGDPAKSTTYKLRLDNETHVRDAMARFSHTRIPKQYRRKVAAEIVRAAKRYGINASNFEAKYPGRKNPDESGAAAKMYKVFHGREPEEILEYQTELERDRDMTALGDLSEIILQDFPTEINFEGDEVILASNPQGTQLFAIGGNQDLSDALRFVEDPDKELIDFGRVRWITYTTRKRFDGFQIIAYEHELGEDGGEQPVLIYDRTRQRMFFAGGEYKVEAPGIIN